MTHAYLGAAPKQQPTEADRETAKAIIRRMERATIQEPVLVLTYRRDGRLHRRARPALRLRLHQPGLGAERAVRPLRPRQPSQLQVLRPAAPRRACCG